MTELPLADRLKLLHSRQSGIRSIAFSRKRKLRELFAVATDDGIPNHDPNDPDAPTATPAEQKFLNEFDILQGRRFDKLTIPARRKVFDAQRLRAIYDSTSIAEATPFAAPAKIENEPLEPCYTNGTKLDKPTNYPRGSIQHASPQATGKASPAGQGAPSTAQPSVVAPKRHKDSSRDQAKEAPAHSASYRQVEGVTGSRASADSASTATAQHPSLQMPAAALPRVDVQISRTDQKPVQSEVDERRDSKDGEPAVSDQQPLTSNPPSHLDTLSSPGSTAQSMLTPAVHDASADTSPDSEATQNLERVEEKAGDELQGDLRPEEEAGTTGEVSPTAPLAPAVSLPTPISGVEAQLLQESAAAQLSQPPDSIAIAIPPRRGPEKITPAATNPTRKGAVGARDKIVDEHQVGSTATRVGSLQHGEWLSDTLAGPSMTPGNASVEDQHRGDGGISTLMDIDKPEDAATENEGVTNVGLSQESHATATTVPAPPQPTGVLAADKTSTAEASVNPRSSSLSLAPIEPTRPVSADRDGSRAIRNEEIDPEAPPTQLKLYASRTRDKRRRSTPTVIFGKQPKRPKPSDDGTVAVGQQQSGHLPSDDYFTPLFIEGFTRQSTWMKPIEKLINQAHKTISTTDQYISMLDHQACKILRRVYHLQQHDKWSLRQPVRCSEPTRPASHWDVLLQEMKWMRTDFREENKWKRTVARNLAHACAEWVHSDPAERLMLQVNAVIPPRPAEVEMKGASLADETLPDLVHTDSPIENEDDLPEILVDCVAPSAIFALPDDEVVFGLQPSKTADLLLENLPLHGSPLTVPKFDVSDTDYDPDAKWKRPAVPLSKYVEGEMVLASNGPPRKRRRYDYLGEDDPDNNDDEVIFGCEPANNNRELQAENSVVALFNPEMKGIRDRLHAGHQFRPPNEHAMPPQSFFESRTASQWTWAEDEQLKSLVRECSYNWSLISAMSSTVSAFASGAERRTPWECFERWVNLVSLDGLPNDMARTPYFKAYQARIDAAQRAIAQHNQNAQQQVGPNGAVTPIPRRRPTTSIRVERRRNQKHLALIDAMRKLAKKREATAQKAQQAANLAAMRKANEVPRQQIQNKTPRDYSIMRWERDQALAERMAAYAIRQADANARRLKQNHPGQVPGTPGAAQGAQTAAQLAAVASANGAARLNVPGQLAAAAAAQNRTPGRVSMPATPGPVPAAVQARIDYPWSIRSRILASCFKQGRYRTSSG
ncbi:hypothetical protein F5144DRAFT_278672 [Chaetomium tenue]|uniref:Uncharacterized protein n=1 Tax=Chaetomium tenue TaxID=1854479 RepID=A0ACB7P1N4_9PEZI|nr:hypothetical protein F5144DRAFT_278672 [Chaetomium globosum]